MRVVTEIDDLVPVKVVLASVFDKTGLEGLIPDLIAQCPEIKIVSTGGTYGKIKDIIASNAPSTLQPIEEFTGAPETEGGLVKTLSRKKSLALLTETYCESHQHDLKKENVTPIDVVIGNLYPFADVVSGNDVTPELARMNIDIGGPNMVREAAKNFHRCAAIVDPGDYGVFLDELKKNHGAMGLEFRFACMKKAFDHIATYNRAIADYFKGVGPDQVRACYSKIH
jgi:phosphoribosylaminoimidazolecarboxamide formyltransferase/IMP cyclohydrolase